MTESGSSVNHTLLSRALAMPSVAFCTAACNACAASARSTRYIDLPGAGESLVRKGTGTGLTRPCLGTPGAGEADDGRSLRGGMTDAPAIDAAAQTTGLGACGGLGHFGGLPPGGNLIAPAGGAAMESFMESLQASRPALPQPSGRGPRSESVGVGVRADTFFRGGTGSVSDELVRGDGDGDRFVESGVVGGDPSKAAPTERNVMECGTLRS
mmetsp:Transcript_10903/g.30532  ORF Transcript_10903/g.30532 Transcript_10903/m.30532 type:complete len:212 (+) Transcript_10903:530-1165(+)